FDDELAVEEPLEIRLGYGLARTRKSISITMRTPGHDGELAAGFLFTEGLVKRPEDINAIEPCGESGNVIRVDLHESVEVDLKRLERHFYTSSSCGVCGKSSLEALKVQSDPLADNGLCVPADLIHELPSLLRRAQDIFDSTGGLHASALFSSGGELCLLREDVGRHNALDKVIGASFLGGHLPLSRSILLVSGRASFELVQKAAVAGIPLFAAVGAPSSLAVELAQERGITLLGFVRDHRFNIYSGKERLKL
ncbi:MAG: formate dehydrogenase accessory sulfurtransferase FdhD, partial [Bdellovibrionota bacterium]